jgi:DNA invertase Pin-like site-specific DNA recombinase
MPKLAGYARVSTADQDMQLQLNALAQAGCAPADIFIDTLSGANTERPGLKKCLAELKRGDTLLVWRLDRLGRSMPHLVSIVESLGRQGIGFRSLCDGAIDTTTASGELIFNIFSSLAQFERKLIQERTRAGLEAARARGRKGGRKKLLSTNPKVVMAKRMHANHGMNIQDICKTLKISRASFYRYIELGEKSSEESLETNGFQILLPGA